jgi:large subunit ribosomal protein L2
MSKKLKRILSKKSGRSHGTVTVRHQGGRHKRFLRRIDFKRDKIDMVGKVVGIEYDPNRGADIALISYSDGEQRYILATKDMKLGNMIVSGESAPLTDGNSLPLVKIPIGTSVHNIEITPGKGAQMVRGAGSSAVIQGKEDDWVLVKLPSTEIKRFLPNAMATIGQLSNEHIKSERVHNAGTNRRRGIRPTVRGTAQNPGSHPHGGGEGRSGVGLKYPKTPYGKPAVGKTRKKGKYSDKLIISKRKPGKHSN